MVSIAFTGAPASSATLTTLFSFNNIPFGAESPVVIGPGGVLYGSTLLGGSGTCVLEFIGDLNFGCGFVYSLTPSTPGGAWTETVLYTFPGYTAGGLPAGNMALVITADPEGGRATLYGMTNADGNHGNGGTVFSLTTPLSGGSVTHRKLDTFSGSAGNNYNNTGGITLGSGGVLYGTLQNGGAANLGIAFSLTPAPGGVWNQTVLHNFGSGSDGAGPYGNLAIGPGGVLYGTTYGSGTDDGGTVFSLTPPASPGGAWTEQVIYDFSYASSVCPEVVVGSSGVVYGMTSAGGAFESGTVFSLTPPATPGGAWTEQDIYTFTGGADGSLPQASVTIGSGGALYGTTLNGGSNGVGTVFSLTPPAIAGDPWTESVLFSFADASTGVNPATSVTLGEGGIIYGTTASGGTFNGGTVFSLAP
jgi:uncharacterized repeat protein (TIGR03803 family)